MKVGDLVRCVVANGEIGLIVERQGRDVRVLLKGKAYPFRARQLEVINESR